MCPENFRRFAPQSGGRRQRGYFGAAAQYRDLQCGRSDRGRGVTRERGYTDIDGLITDRPDVVLCTQYADCVPLFFVDPVRRAVATSHAGWKGTAARIAAVTVDRMCADYGCRRGDILVGIGPSIGRCCFEVDTPVYEIFAKMDEFDESCFVAKPAGKYNIDLWEINRRTLLKSGILPNITVTDLCTRCHPDVFWSTGRRVTCGLAALISL